MDPDTALKEIIELARDVDLEQENSDQGALAEALALKVLELRDWITHGGFAPKKESWTS